MVLGRHFEFPVKKRCCTSF